MLEIIERFAKLRFFIKNLIVKPLSKFLADAILNLTGIADSSQMLSISFESIIDIFCKNCRITSIEDNNIRCFVLF